MRYLHGVPIGRICEYMGIGAGSSVKLFRLCAGLFEGIIGILTKEYRQALVKHADESNWRTLGKNGYVWLFATIDPSIFLFGKNRSAKVPQEVLGTDPFPGVLVVDRYATYSKSPCKIQYCCEHLLREVQDLEKEFPEDAEVAAFAAIVIPQLSLAMGLRTQPISDETFYRRAAARSEEIKSTMRQPARQLGIRRIQDIFRENEHRLFHWADDRSVPAENDRSERDLRPSVIARKVSFGSGSDAGAWVRSILTTAAVTIRKRSGEVRGRIKLALDLLAVNPKSDPYPVLFGTSNPYPP